MKMILKEDLQTLLKYDDRNTYDETSFKNLLAKFGDDYFIRDGEWILTKENEYMKTIRDHSRRVINANQEIR